MYIYSLFSRTLILATGISTPSQPQFEGFNLTIGYDEMPLDPEFYEGKSVLILGKYDLYYFNINPSSASLRYTWWRYQMETFSALLAICEGNSPVTGDAEL